MTLPNGPYETEDQALADPAVQGIYAAMRRSPQAARMQDGSSRLIFTACAVAGVELGDYDVRIIRWVAGFEPQSSAVIAGLITRAAVGEQDAAATAEAGDDASRCAQCGGPAETYPDPYMDRMLWRHQRGQVPVSVAEFLDAEHEAAPAGAL
jgi:hypothetical protein